MPPLRRDRSGRATARAVRVAASTISLGALQLLLVAVAGAPVAAQATAAADARPTLAVLNFENSALGTGANADYAPLSKGMAELLIATLGENPNIRVVERAQLQKLVDEQNLGNSERADKETVARIGRIVGAQHMLTGGFVIDRNENMRIVVRAVNAETSEIEYTQSITGRANDLLPMVSELGAKINEGLRLPSRPTGARASAGEAKGPGQFRAVMLVSRALERQDRGDAEGAIALYRQALVQYPDFQRAKSLLAALERGPSPSRP